ncbi:MAG: TIGR01212 family radical SAM protein [Candidatus Kappaea frigidicola]|nr:TIGR01212 family radical SAM protein [Candidatus Kappaea frigidicola]
MNMSQKPRYRKFSDYLKERFNERVYKVSVDAGFSCPNKDGKFSSEGCIFCDNRTFNAYFGHKPVPLKEQIANGIRLGGLRYKAKKFLVYFQANTNTYASIEELKNIYDTVNEFDNVVGLMIGTRPDCIDNEILDLIEKYSEKYEVWLEYGLQSIHDKTLKLINRNHTYEDFLKAYDLTKNRNIKVCPHVILGLPNETTTDMLTTAKEISRLKPEAIKIHPLHIVKDTNLEKFYKKDKFKIYSLGEYFNLLIEFLRYLNPEIIIARLSANCPKELLVEPKWLEEKARFIQLLDKEMDKRDVSQGDLYQE